MTDQRRAAISLGPVASTYERSQPGIPLADHSVDVDLVDTGRAIPEVARDLSPGGRLGLIWNMRDEPVDRSAAWARS